MCKKRSIVLAYPKLSYLQVSHRPSACVIDSESETQSLETAIGVVPFFLTRNVKCTTFLLSPLISERYHRHDPHPLVYLAIPTANHS